MDDSYSFSKVLDVKEEKKGGKIEKKFLMKWNPSYETAANLNRCEKELMNQFVKVEVLGPADVPANQKLTDPKRMIWGVKKTNRATLVSETQHIAFKMLREEHAEELTDFLLQHVAVETHN